VPMSNSGGQRKGIDYVGKHLLQKASFNTMNRVTPIARREVDASDPKCCICYCVVASRHNAD
jgi:hypothetical protein